MGPLGAARSVGDLNWVLAGYSLLLAACVWGVSRRYGTLINPVSYFGCFFGLQTLVVPVLFTHFDLLDLHEYSAAALVKTIGLSALYFGAISTAFMFRKSPFTRGLQFLLPKDSPRVGGLTRLLASTQVIAAFGLLMAASSAGMLWFSNPRDAYQNCRIGAGLWWALSQASLLLVFTLILFTKRHSAKRVFAISLLFVSMTYFLGSKAFMLNYLVLAVFYVEHAIGRVDRRALIATAVFAFPVLAALQMLQGTAGALLDTLSYFDYFTNTGKFISDFGTIFEHRYGQAMLSDFWLYVPRALYSEKPYVYGAQQIMETYLPGVAENTGSTPGILPWAGSYWDFGAAGVLVNGLITGFIARASFDLFRCKRGIWSFLLFGQIGLLSGDYAQIFFRAPIVVFFLWLYTQRALIGAAEGIMGHMRGIEPKLSLTERTNG